MRLYAGSSGFSYKEWLGPFYPEGVKAATMLPHYGSKLDTVEVNNTFYRMPKASVLEGWAGQVPEHFRFVLKASQRITHKGRLKDVDDSVAYLWKMSAPLMGKLGPFLFQLPPYLKRGDERLKSFLGGLPEGMGAALEFRHESWMDESVFAILEAHGASLCISDTDEGEDDGGALTKTSDVGYLRLRREAYGDDELQTWLARIAACDFREVYVFFKHEDDGAAPKLAMRLAALAAGG